MESQYRTSLRGTFCVEADTQSHNYHCLRLLRLKKSRNDVLNKAFTYNRNSHNILTYIKSNKTENYERSNDELPANY